MGLRMRIAIASDHAALDLKAELRDWLIEQGHEVADLGPDSADSVDYPDFGREMEILHARVPEAADTLSREIVAFVQRLRTEDIFKRPGVAETIDWAKCLLALDVIALSPQVISDTLGAILKYQDDIARLQGSEAKRILDEARASLEPA